MKCKGKTRDKRWPYPSSQCMANEWKDGYCKRHHPEERRRKQAERDAKKEAYRLAFEKQDEGRDDQKG